MEEFAITSLGLILIAAGLVLLIRRNLRQRPKARALRARFVAIADDLVGKPDFPDAAARQLVILTSFPEGWLTRFLVLMIFREMLFGNRSRRRPRPASAISFDQIPAALRPKYVMAIIAFILSDSHRCALFGHVLRAVLPWLVDTIQEVKPDVNAHATRRVVEQVFDCSPPRYVHDALCREDALCPA